ncbi:MAG: recombinase family protein [Planctomycetota bacterium]|nr:recombinase family protein [Planctomycetota bacterium]
MFISLCCELLSVLSISLLVLAPAVIINSRADGVLQRLTREEIEERTAHQVNELWAWYRLQLSPETALGTGTAYARFSTRQQESVVDQLRKCLEHAVQLKIYISREHVFYDLATSGRKTRRPGLMQLEAVLRAKKVKTLLLFSTSRLFRRTYMTLAFVDRAHTSWGIRCIFVASHVDTDDREQWQMLLTMHAMVDQFVISVHSHNVRAGHEGAFERRHVFGTISYGFFGEILVGEFTPKGKPRRLLKIDPQTAETVRRIYRLFVVEERGLKEIARILNADSSVQLPRLCRSGIWTDDSVRRVLKNTRYRGLWQYGVTESRFLPEEDYVRQIPRLEPTRQAQIEELRIVDDSIWFAAAQLLAENDHANAGRKPADSNHAIRPKSLNGLLFCVEHERPLVVAGANGRMMICPVCQLLPAIERQLVSWLNRRNALDLVCRELARRILQDEELIKLVIDACKREAESNQQATCGDVTGLKTKRDKLQRAIDCAMTNVGEADEDKVATARFIRERRVEKAQVEAELSKLTAARKTKVEIPSSADVRRLLKDLAQLLTDAGQSEDASERAVLRRLIKELTGGQIIVSQQGERKRQHGWLRGTFQLRLLKTTVNRISDGAIVCNDEGVEVTIDFKRPLSIDAKAEIAWQMNQDHKRHAEIAEVLHCCGSYVTRLLKYYAEKYGLKWVDGRSLRLNFPPQTREPALFKRIVDSVMEMYNRDFLEGEIAQQLSVNRTTVKKSVDWYHTEHNLRPENGRTRAGRIKRERNRVVAPT